MEFNYKDAFLTVNDKVYLTVFNFYFLNNRGSLVTYILNSLRLMIAFSSKENDDTFKLGQIFLYKYKFTFDYDNREIGFYLNDLKNAKIAHRIKRAFRGKTFFTILLLVVIVIFLCYYLRKKGYIGKKKIIDFNTANKNITHFTNENIEQGYELKTDI